MTARHWQGENVVGEWRLADPSRAGLWDRVTAVWSFVAACYRLSIEIDEKFNDIEGVRYPRGLTRKELLEKIDEC